MKKLWLQPLMNFYLPMSISMSVYDSYLIICYILRILLNLEKLVFLTIWSVTTSWLRI